MNNLGGNYVLNSYAYHCRPLISTISAFLPVGFDSRKIEALFIEMVDQSEQTQYFHYSPDNQDKIRKRMLLSANYSTAYKAKHVLQTFNYLRNCKIDAPHLFKR